MIDPRNWSYQSGDSVHALSHGAHWHEDLRPCRLTLSPQASEPEAATHMPHYTLGADHNAPVGFTSRPCLRG